MAAERIITARELNRALLARQLLLERSRAPLPRALERVGGIQAQYAPSTYVGLWSRLHALSRDQVTRALERRRAVQATLMRMTIHVVARRDFWPLALGTRPARRARWLRTHPEAEAALRTAADRVRERLAGGRPLARARGARDAGRASAGGGRRAVGRPGAPAALRDVGAPARRSVRPRRELGGAARGLRGGG
ncbi:MAG TPA: crosslink repair DNA glycosylase YcaQ family protein, partial [Solirubrobacteraceae bacterium]|nr:crosslink repair DNA glycosylase YcaQ family protein [Solirubrobacteraceae bacterium]